MGYYRSEYEDYYRGIKGNGIGKSSYLRGSEYSNINSMNVRTNSRRKKSNGIIEMVLTQVIGIALIGGLVYGISFSERAELKETHKKITDIIATDNYFNEKELILNLKDKVLELGKQIEVK